MTLVSLVFILAVVGFLAWIVLQIPMAQPVRNIILGVICFFLVIWLAQQFGIIGGNLRLQ